MPSFDTDDDLRDLEAAPASFSSRPRHPDREQCSRRQILEARGRDSGSLRAILVMDPPEHRDYRKLAVTLVHAARHRERRSSIAEESARGLVDGLALSALSGRRGGVRVRERDRRPLHPLRILCDHPRRATRRRSRSSSSSPAQLFASDDPDLQRKGEDRRAGRPWRWPWSSCSSSMRIIEDRRANPTRRPRDAFSPMASVNGEPMGPHGDPGLLPHHLHRGARHHEECAWSSGHPHPRPASRRAREAQA